MRNKRYGYSHQCIDESDIDSVTAAVSEDFLTCGPKVAEFEQRICEYTGAKYCVSVTNATAGLHIAALAAGLSVGDEAITSPITFLSTANCVRFCGASIKFADIEEDTANIDPKEIEKQITSKTKAIFPVHFAGQSCDMKQIFQTARRNGLLVIEDAAHAFGSDYNGAKVGSCEYSDMTVFSFHPVKNITTGEGGAVTTNNYNLYKKLLSLRSHGMHKEGENVGTWKYEMLELGFNYRLTDIQSALGLSQLGKIEKFKSERRHIIDLYNKHLNWPHLAEKPYSCACFHLYPVLIPERDKFYFEAKKVGLDLQVHYIPVHLQPYYKQFGFKRGDFPKAECYYSRTISLPLYPSLDDDDIFEIIDRLKKLRPEL